MADGGVGGGARRRGGRRELGWHGGEAAGYPTRHRAQRQCQRPITICPGSNTCNVNIAVQHVGCASLTMNASL